MKRITVILPLLLVGCNSDDAPNAPTITNELPIIQATITAEPVQAKISTPIIEAPKLFKMSAPPEPEKLLPTFVPDGINTESQQPYSGEIYRGGDIYLKYDPEIKYIQDFITPDFTVEYKYQPLLEVIIDNEIETLCSRYDFKTKKYGIPKLNCLWSTPSDFIELEDLQAGYYGYRITETRIWFNGAVGLDITVK